MSSSPNRLLATIFGAVYLVVGLLGFTATAGVGFFDTSGGLLLGLFEVNIFHNVAHLLIGAALFIAGMFLVGSSFNILAINAADNVLHFGSAVILLAVGLGTEKTRTARA
jgi:hypothetical protein